MKFLSAVLALVAFAAPLVNAATNCATGPTMLTDITYFEMGPMAFCPSKICISFIGTMNGMVVAGAKGKFSISAKVGGKEVYTSVQDTCKVARCPTTAGYMILPLPDTADFPAHVADFTLKMTNGDGKTVFCQALTYGTPVPTTTTTTTTTTAPTPTYSPLPPRLPESQNCANTTTTQDVTAFTITPRELCIDQLFNLTVAGPLSAPIVEGTMLRIVGRLGYRPLYKDEVDLCQLLAAAGTPCPVPTTVASWSIQRILQMRAIAMPLAYTFDAYHPQDGGRLFCRQTFFAGKNCTAPAV